MFHLLQHELFAHQTAEEQSKEKGERKKRIRFFLSPFSLPFFTQAQSRQVVFGFRR